ncbi:MAG: cytochrome c3 family protein [Anaerolineales bacterium]|nr:cytochrome c3 family protein [Anaerolineales bacterium]
MQNRRLGCFSGTSIFVAIVTALVIAGYAYARGGLLYNPGPLNAQRGEMLGGVTSHAETGGDCKTCHTAPWERATMADRCLDCHSDLSGQLQDFTSLHGRMMKDAAVLTCRNCHPEHRGADASLTEMDELTFPHEALGYSLRGHQFTAARKAFTCADCHADDISNFDLQTCDTCHRQMDAAFTETHEANWGGDCLLCHDGVDTYGNDFDHNRLAFPLAGGHANISCYDCHANARTITDLQSASQDCATCHAADDVHAGKFGADCASCHTPSDWKDATFDHSRSDFPLTGAHQQVECEKCHVNDQFAGTPNTCAACHADPVFHLGLFGTDCAACHTTTAWSPATFNEPHTFPLNHGDGGTVSCATCHPSAFTTYTCYGCHEHTEIEIHSKHIEEGVSDFQNCAECHSTGQKHEGDERKDGDD